jgi:hypothetical protein
MLKDIAKEYNCDLSILYDIKNGLSYKNVLPELDLRHIKHSNSGNSKLNESDVKEIKRKLLQENSIENIREISKIFRVSVSTIRSIKDNKSWINVAI